mmetsp:Transcript_13979/g.27069  ORF Transcript_13979/g.27069 Transcript_13979/m.27069 type:complete len:222 (+) Transcript_13979:5786-6451(+)
MSYVSVRMGVYLNATIVQNFFVARDTKPIMHAKTQISHIRLKHVPKVIRFVRTQVDGSQPRFVAKINVGCSITGYRSRAELHAVTINQRTGSRINPHNIWDCILQVGRRKDDVVNISAKVLQVPDYIRLTFWGNAHPIEMACHSFSEVDLSRLSCRWKSEPNGTESRVRTQDVGFSEPEGISSLQGVGMTCVGHLQHVSSGCNTGHFGRLSEVTQLFPDKV